MAGGKAGQSHEAADASPPRARVVDERAQYQRVVDEANVALRELRAQLRREQEERIAMQVELDNLKKGSVAMMKYVTNLQRKKHDEELEALQEEAASLRKRLRDPTEALERPTKKGAKWEERERDLVRREEELEGGFARLKEDQQLRQDAALAKFEEEMGRLPEMQKLVIERDDTIRALKRELERRDEILYFKMAEAMAQLQAGAPVDPRFSTETADGIQAVLVRLRHELEEKEGQLERQATDFQVKLRNTINLMRIKYEKELKDASAPKGWRAKRGQRRG